MPPLLTINLSFIHRRRKDTAWLLLTNAVQLLSLLSLIHSVSGQSEAGGGKRMESNKKVACHLVDQLKLITCINQLSHNFTAESLHPTIRELPELCDRYATFTNCSEDIPKSCKAELGALSYLDSMFDAFCDYASEPIIPCLTEFQETEKYRKCHQMDKNITYCEWYQNYVDCLTVEFWEDCSDGVTVLSNMLNIALNGTCLTLNITEPVVDLTKPKCAKNEENQEGNGVSTTTCTCESSGLTLDTATNTCIDQDECQEVGICGQRCRNEFGSYSCECNTDYYSLNNETGTCERLDNSSIWIFFAHGQSIWNISADGKDFQLQRAALQKTAMIDLDVEGRLLYYADIGANKMERMSLEGAFPETIQSYDVQGTEGIAVDWIAKNLYSLRQRALIVQALDGRYRRILYKNVVNLPRALVLHPLIGWAYVSDWSGQAFIGRAAMDGSKVEKLITEAVVWPNGLAIDYYADKLYWADAFLDTIECSDLDGGGRRSVVAQSGSVPHVFGLAIMDNHIYWTDWTYRGILRADKNTVENPCDALNCSQLCVITPAKPEQKGSEGKNVGPEPIGARCMCAQGWQLDPQEIGICRANCGVDEVLCGGSDPKCISRVHWCDGRAECRDGADEKNCPPRKCSAGEFQCHDGTGCILSALICNGEAECRDASDEKYCQQ